MEKNVLSLHSFGEHGNEEIKNFDLERKAIEKLTIQFLK
jgi:hypothetical protein